MQLSVKESMEPSQHNGVVYSSFWFRAASNQQVKSLTRIF
jgi:hypothetical protein